MQILNIPYGDTALREFDFYLPPNPSQNITICFVHGGAWRSEDKQDHAALARKIAHATDCPVLVPNYRLTTTSNSLQHPNHAHDILDFLRFILDWAGPSDLIHSCNFRNLFLIGHSCSAHMLASVVLDSHAITPSLDPPPLLLSAVKAVLVSEGIYDIDLLIDHFPTYLDWFIKPAFGTRESYTAFNATQYPLRSSGDYISWALVHSKGDTLIDLAQSDKMFNHLSNLYGDRAETHVYRNVDQLDGEHNEILRGDQYVGIVKDFLSRVHGSTPQVISN